MKHSLSTDADINFEGGLKRLLIFDFPGNALTGVILGAGVTKELVEEIRMLIGTKELSHVSLKNAKLSLRTFDMEFEKA